MPPIPNSNWGSDFSHRTKKTHCRWATGTTWTTSYLPTYPPVYFDPYLTKWRL